jgi:hypothetical protein
MTDAWRTSCRARAFGMVSARLVALGASLRSVVCHARWHPRTAPRGRVAESRRRVVGTEARLATLATRRALLATAGWRKDGDITNTRERPRGRGRPARVRSWVHMRGELTTRNIGRESLSGMPGMAEEETGVCLKTGNGLVCHRSWVHNISDLQVSNHWVVFHLRQFWDRCWTTCRKCHEARSR